MNKLVIIAAISACMLFSPINAVFSQKTAVYSYPIEMELTNDQGDMLTKDYLKNYGTKGKRRGIEIMYENVTPFLVNRLQKSGIEILSIDTLASVKSNEYGKPATTLSKAAATGIADQYMKIYLKEVTQPDLASMAQQDVNVQKRKTVKMSCRIQLYDNKKKLIKEAEGEFQSGDKIENPSELGVDFRKYQGSEYLQEIKIYETCCKMSVIKALTKLAQ